MNDIAELNPENSNEQAVTESQFSQSNQDSLSRDGRRFKVSANRNSATHKVRYIEGSHMEKGACKISEICD